jgi:hypothetical protein
MERTKDLPTLLEEADEWARPRVTFHARHHRGGHHGLARYARLKVGDLVFESELLGPITKRESIHERVREDVIRQFLDWASAIIRSGGWPADPPFTD